MVTSILILPLLYLHLLISEAVAALALCNNTYLIDRPSNSDPISLYQFAFVALQKTRQQY